jgi:hydrogenase maturation protein HypF
MERRAIAIQGTVQGVGFRPYVFGLASSLDLGGFVRNGTGGVRIEVEGERSSLDQFVSRVIANPPPLALIERWSCSDRQPTGERKFRIETSDVAQAGEIAVAPDAATCEDCLAELFDPSDRRYRYPFLNCTNCGPRLTIVRSVPYDRERTTMSGFAMCERCRAEYDNPADRRFHAQPNACPACGPNLTAVDANGNSLAEKDGALALFATTILNGGTGALKGIGGYHLVCDARSDAAVAELRRRKHRDDKPFAIMVRDINAARALCELEQAETALLTSPRRPISLLRKRNQSSLADAVAPGNPFLGIMLPYAPVHHLLLHDLQNIPLVMTSGNRSDEPIAYDEADALQRLAGIADVFLTHDRPIHVRCDDSVTRIINGAESPIRRSRGYAPHPVPLPISCPAPILAVGGQLKATFALGDRDRAILSHHMGDLDQFEAYQAFEQDVALYEQLFSLQPQYIAHDLHPDYATTQYANQRVIAQGIQLVPIQHHHAHMASCMAEHGLNEPVIGVTFDGTGYGTDGAIWGGEILVGDYRQFRRAAHLRYVGMPGGERAIREPWRMALSHLHDAGIELPSLSQRLPADAARTVKRMLERKLNSPSTSSAGRLFDAVASLANVRDRVSFEGQAAVQLEWLATESSDDGHYPYAVSAPLDDGSPMLIDTRPLIREVAAEADRGVDRSVIARRFHNTLAAMIIEVCGQIRKQTGINTVVLSGGVFMNALLATQTERLLGESGFVAYRHQRVPPNDGGLSLGQLAVAAAQLSFAAEGSELDSN